MATMLKAITRFKTKSSGGSSHQARARASPDRAPSRSFVQTTRPVPVRPSRPRSPTPPSPPSSRHRPQRHSKGSSGGSGALGGGPMHAELADSLEPFTRYEPGDFDVDAFAATHYGDANEKRIRALASQLGAMRARADTELKRNVFAHYAAFIRVSAEITKLRGKVIELRKEIDAPRVAVESALAEADAARADSKKTSTAHEDTTHKYDPNGGGDIVAPIIEGARDADARMAFELADELATATAERAYLRAHDLRLRGLKLETSLRAAWEDATAPIRARVEDARRRRREERIARGKKAAKPWPAGEGDWEDSDTDTEEDDDDDAAEGPGPGEEEDDEDLTAAYERKGWSTTPRDDDHPVIRALKMELMRRTKMEERGESDDLTPDPLTRAMQAKLDGASKADVGEVLAAALKAQDERFLGPRERRRMRRFFRRGGADDDDDRLVEPAPLRVLRRVLDDAEAPVLDALLRAVGDARVCEPERVASATALRGVDRGDDALRAALRRVGEATRADVAAVKGAGVGWAAEACESFFAALRVAPRDRAVVAAADHMSDATREVIVAWIEEETTAFAETFAAKAVVCGGGGVEVARMPRASAAVLLALGHADAMPGDLGGRESVFDGVAGHVAACPAFFDAMKRVVDAATDAYLGAGDDDEEEEEEEEEGEEGARGGGGGSGDWLDVSEEYIESGGSLATLRALCEKGVAD